MSAPNRENLPLSYLSNEGDWTPVGCLEVASGKLVVCDLMRLFCPPRKGMLETAEGSYRVSVKEVTESASRCVTRLRVARDSATVSRSRLRNIEIESARLAVFDPIPVRRHRRELGDEDLDATCAQLGSTGPYGLLPLGESFIAVVQPGFGDGCYPLFVLVEDHTPVGFEVVFLGPDVLHPSEKDLISRICLTESTNSLDRLFRRRIHELGGSGSPTLFEDLAVQVPAQAAYSLIPHAADVVLFQANAASVISALGLLMSLVRASNTTELSPGLADRWEALSSMAAKHAGHRMIVEFWSDLCRWYRRA